MVTQIILFEEYCFSITKFGTDHIEAIQYEIDNLFGKSVVKVHNKRGDIIMVMFLGEISTVKKSHILSEIESNCNLIYLFQREVRYKIEYLNILKSIHGEKLVIK